MKIPTFKFGSTPLFYTPDGTIARGIILPPKSIAYEFAQWVFAFSVALLLWVLVFSMGRAWLVRFRYAAKPVLGRVTQSALMQEFLPRARTIAALLPLAAPTDTSTYRNIEVSPSRIPTLTIPKLGIVAPIVESSLDLKTLNSDLKNGVIRWPESAALGTAGVTVLLGHSSAPLSYYGEYGAVFALLDKLVAGDTFFVEGRDGQTITYKVHDRLIINRQGYDPDYVTSASDRETLILVSCWPVGTSWQRIAVRAERVP